ncbi:MAG: hypothetical protein Tsb0034_06230 [Ekhidna sp.]
MGFHVILKHSEEKLDYHYAQNEVELSRLPIKEDSIIYEGEPNWKPEIVGKSSRYKRFAYDYHRIGIQAQEIFKKEAVAAGFILEELNQDQDSFRSYTDLSKNISIKRGDFLIRNALNLEVDVKCRTFKTNKAGESVFEFNCHHLTCHLNMQNHFTDTDIIIALYERCRKTKRLKEESLMMIDVKYMERKVNELNLKRMKRSNSSGEVYHIYQFPVSLLWSGFDLISYHMNKAL